eukprot:2822113-Amphidinium_carterae.1
MQQTVSDCETEPPRNIQKLLVSIWAGIYRWFSLQKGQNKAMPSKTLRVVVADAAFEPAL